MNQEQLRKHTVPCFRRATYYTCVFDMVCVGTCESNHMFYPSRLDTHLKDQLVYMDVQTLSSSEPSLENKIKSLSGSNSSFDHRNHLESYRDVI